MNIKETDLAKQVVPYFKKLKYEIRSEVYSCDIVALKENELIIIELKINFTSKLLYQAIRRQKYSDLVYIAIVRPKTLGPKSNYKVIKTICQRLNIGLILVDLTEKKPIEVKLTPIAGKKQLSTHVLKRRQTLLLKEFHARSGDYNLAGQTGVRLVSSFKEKSVEIAALLKKKNQLKAKEVRDFTKLEKAQVILSRNHLGWFEKVDRGIYQLITGKEKEIKKEYSELWKLYINKYK